MPWFHPFSALFVVLLLVPNIVFALTHKEGFSNRFQNRLLELLEQIGRFGCFLFMIVCPPGLCAGWWFSGAKTIYLIAGGALTALYLLGWIVFWKEDSVRKSLTLSVLPSLLFLESGFLTRSLPLLLAAVLFAPCHTLSRQGRIRFLRAESAPGCIATARRGGRHAIAAAPCHELFPLRRNSSTSSLPDLKEFKAEP